MRYVFFYSLLGAHLLAGAQLAQSSDRIVIGSTALASRVLTTQVAADSIKGLTGQYFNNSTLAGKPVLQRQDATLNFEWGKGAPAPGVSADYFSVRWQGLLKAPATGSYSFFVRPGEQVRLWVGGQKVLDTWDGSTALSDAYVTLAAGETTQFTLEYHSEEGAAHLQLQWTAPGKPRQAVPAEVFGAGVAAGPMSGKKAVAVAAPRAAAKPASAKPAPVAPATKATPPPTPATPLSGVYTLKVRATGKPLLVEDDHRPGPNGPEAKPAVPQWTIEPAGQGYYRLSVQGGSKVLEVLGSSSANGAALELWPYYSGNNQLWQIQKVGDGYYSLLAKHSRKALTAKDSTEGGLQQWRYANRETQQWRLEPAVAPTQPTKIPPHPITGGGAYKVSVYPNPSNGVAQLQFQLPDSTPVGWVLYDTRGVVVRTSDYRRQTEGIHQQSLPFATLPAGDYRLHLTVGSVTTTQPVLIRHTTE